MEIQEINSVGEWDSAVHRCSSFPSFTQSFEWGEILVSEGKNVSRFVLVEKGTVCGAAQIVYQNIGAIKYGFCPKGPLFAKELARKKESLELLAKEIGKRGNAFLRFESPSKTFFSGAEKKTIDINPRATVVINLEQAESELLKKMHTKTRYNIRLAEKKELKIAGEKNFEAFWQLMTQTGIRDRFRLHAKKHYEAIFNSRNCYQLTAYSKNQPAATVILFGFAGTLTYLFGASDYEKRGLMAPQLLQWEGMKLGKKLGFKRYDLFGIAPNKNPGSKPENGEEGYKIDEYQYDEHHQYAGVTRFKLGFGGEVIEQPGTYDLIISPGTYSIYLALRKLRRIIKI